jgi:hypothetical protein
MTSAVQQSTARMVRLTECHGVNHEQRRDVWVNPAQVTRINEYHLYGTGQRVTMIRFAPDDLIWVAESPECVAGEMGWIG